MRIGLHLPQHRACFRIECVDVCLDVTEVNRVAPLPDRVHGNSGAGHRRRFVAPVAASASRSAEVNAEPWAFIEPVSRAVRIFSLESSLSAAGRGARISLPAWWQPVQCLVKSAAASFAEGSCAEGSCAEDTEAAKQ